MKKLILCAAYLLFSLIAEAQGKKVPVYELADDEILAPDMQAAKGVIQGFTQIELKPDYTGSMDTTDVRYIKFYPNGYLQSKSAYEYLRPDKQNNKDALFKVKSRFFSGVRTDYEYDSRNNIIAYKEYMLSPRNSYSALSGALMEALAQEKLRITRELTKDGLLSEADQDTLNLLLPQRAKRISDSLFVTDVEEQAHLIEEDNYVYDKNDNPVSRSNPVRKNDSRYFYTYSPERYVQTQRIHYHSTSIGFLQYSTTEYHFSYDGKGKITSVITYVADNDSGNIATDRYLRKKEITHYNSKSLPDSITVQQYDVHELHILTYIDTFVKSHTTLSVAYGTIDTLNHNTYKYSNKLLSEVRHTEYYEGKRVSGSEAFYDKHQLPVEVREYDSIDGVQFDNLVSQKVFFYGLASDKATAGRMLKKVARRDK